MKQESEIIKLKDGPANNAAKVLEKLNALGWETEVLRSDEIHCHGTSSNDFRHTYIWTVLCVK